MQYVQDTVVLSLVFQYIFKYLKIYNIIIFDTSKAFQSQIF